ncbi:STAS domain-containing protein [Micromonospora sp. BQ11]|uniref:STAS domain-containing protein n=1 Tax=Micromonospora sp. BQ11 TaxID=3452212 RepID=UPI003F88D3CF
MTLLLSGEIDLSGVARFADVLREAAYCAPGARVDMAQLAFLDSIVLSALIGRHRMPKSG